jgi:hypothetical protein
MSPNIKSTNVVGSGAARMPGLPEPPELPALLETIGVACCTGAVTGRTAARTGASSRSGGGGGKRPGAGSAAAPVARLRSCPMGVPALFSRDNPKTESARPSARTPAPRVVRAWDGGARKAITRNDPRILRILRIIMATHPLIVLSCSKHYPNIAPSQGIKSIRGDTFNKFSAN